MNSPEGSRFVGPLTLLRQALEHLASSAVEQREYLTLLDVAPSIDELALEFDDAIGPIRHLFADQRFPDDLRSPLVRIDEILNEASRPPASETAWDWEDLDREFPWGKLRPLARHALKRVPEIGYLIDNGGGNRP